MKINDVLDDVLGVDLQSICSISPPVYALRYTSTTTDVTVILCFIPLLALIHSYLFYQLLSLPDHMVWRYQC